MTEALVGRRRETAALAPVADGSAAGRVLLLAGEAGIGKTTLLKQGIDHARASGRAVLVARGAADEGTPAFWPWRRVLEQAGLPAGLLDAEPSPVESPEAARFRVVERTARALLDRDTLLALDDLHWFDASSLRLLAYLCSEMDGSRLSVLGAFRDPDAQRPLPEPLVEISGSGAVRVLRPAPLTVADVAEYLRRAGRADPAWPARVHRDSGGNPLFVRELTRSLDEGTPDASPELARLIERRLAGLGPECRRLLGLAAVCGEEIDAALLGGISGSEISGLLAEAVAQGILQDDLQTPSRLRFGHDVVRRVVYETMAGPERVAWHTRIADALSEVGSPAEVARHRVRAAVDAEGFRLAADACRDAGREAVREFAHDDAVEWFDQALGFLERLGGSALAGSATPSAPDQDAEEPAPPGLTAPPDPAEPSRLRLESAVAAFRAGRIDDALARCTSVLAAAERLDRPDLAAAAATVVRGVGGDQNRTIIDLCERARRLLADQPGAAHARVLAHNAVALMTLGDPEAAEPLSRTAIAMAESCDDLPTLIDALSARYACAVAPELIADRLAAGARMRDLGAVADRPDAELWGHVWRMDEALMLGSIAVFDTEFQGLNHLADRLGLPIALWHAQRAGAVRALLVGRFAEAERIALQARATAMRTQDRSAPTLFFPFIEVLIRLTGRFGEYPEFLDLPLPGFQPIVASTRGRHLLAAGDLDRAAEHLDQLRPVIGTLPIAEILLPIVLDTGELAAGLGDLAVAEICYRRLMPYRDLYVNKLPAAKGTASRVLGVIAHALGRFDDAEAHLAQAVTMEHRIGAAPFEAVARLDHARALIARGRSADRARALEQAEAAAHIARRLGMPPTATAAAELADQLSGVRGGPAALTAREREIAALIAEGVSNREIAGRFTLSERTVESHVRSILNKLGLSNRTQVAAWALRTGLRG